MWLALAALVLCACGGARPVAIANRGEPAGASCRVPAKIDLEGRRYANLDHGDPDYQVWSAWRIGLQLADRDEPRGTLAMVGDELTWTFDVTGTLDRETCRLALAAHSHEPFDVVLELRGPNLTGTIRSIDDVWLLGPPFPAARP